jgi:hypothetical protein
LVLGISSAVEAPADAHDIDVVALGGPPASGVLERLAGALAPGGCLVARWTSAARADAALNADLTRCGLALRESVDASGTGVLRAQKTSIAQPSPARPLELFYVAFSPLLMDIRTRLPMQWLKADPELRPVYALAPLLELPKLHREVPKVVVLQRPAEVDANAWRPFLADAVAGGWVVVLEYDDHPWLIAEMQNRAAFQADMLRFGFAHAVQTATPALVEAFRPYNPEIALFPNAVFELAPFPEGERPRRIFYGAVLRGSFAVEVARSLGPAIERFPDAHFEVIGDREVFAALPTDAKTFHEYMSYEGYLRLMGGCAVSLSPVETLPRRETKSDAKFLDAARAGVLTIASPPIYEAVIEHGVNGLIARTVPDWAPLLAAALSDPAGSREMAKRAWEYVRAERMFAHQAAARGDWYRDLWARREALNEALMRRVPGLREAVAAELARGRG